MKQERAKDVRGTLAESPDRKSLPRATNLGGASIEAPQGPLAALGPADTPRDGAPPRQGRKLAVVGAVCALTVAAASLLVLRPHAQPRPGDGEPFPVVTGNREVAPAHNTYAVRLGPFHDPQAVLQAHERLLELGFQPLLVKSNDGTYLRAFTAPTEQEALRVAQGFKEQGYSTFVIESSPEAGLARGSSADPKYHVDGVMVGFEGGQTKGWDGAMSVTGVRNSSLFSFAGQHSLEASVQDATVDRPGRLRFHPESVVLPQDVFVARVLLPRGIKGRVGVRWYLIDANGKYIRDSGMPLRPGQWIVTRYTLLPRVAMPIQELGLDIVAPQGASWSGTVYVDNVEQQRAR